MTNLQWPEMVKFGLGAILLLLLLARILMRG
jgi:hypothetical protein